MWPGSSPALILAESRLRKLYEAIADGQASVREPVFANILAETNARVASATASVEMLERDEAWLNHGVPMGPIF